MQYESYYSRVVAAINNRINKYVLSILQENNVIMNKALH